MLLKPVSSVIAVALPLRGRRRPKWRWNRKPRGRWWWWCQRLMKAKTLRMSRLEGISHPRVVRRLFPPASFEWLLVCVTCCKYYMLNLCEQVNEFDMHNIMHEYSIIIYVRFYMWIITELCMCLYVNYNQMCLYVTELYMCLYVNYNVCDFRIGWNLKLWFLKEYQ
jgi:hypothetical protein